MRIERIDLLVLRNSLIRPFSTSSSRRDYLEHIIVKAYADGWSAGASAPARSTRTTAKRRPRPAGTSWRSSSPRTCWEGVVHPEEVVALYGKVKRNNFAKAGLEMACWDLLAKAEGKPLHAMLGGTRSEILSGVSLGIEDDLGRLMANDRSVRRRGVPPGQAEDRPRQGRERGLGRAREVPGPAADGRRELGVHPGRRRGAQGAGPLRPDDDRAAAGLRRHRGSRRASEPAPDADLPRREHPLGRRRPPGAQPRTAAGSSTSRSAAWAACSNRRRSTTTATPRACRSGAAACTSTASAGPRTWRSPACRASRCRATSRARTSTTPATSWTR